MRLTGLALLLAWEVATLAGCVLVGREAKLYYPPAPDEGEAPPPPAVAPSADAPALSVVVSDARPEPREELGPVRNAFGMKMSAVTSKDDVPAWVTSALVAEFQAVGLRVAQPAAGAAAPERVTVLAVEVRKVQCDAYFTYGAEVMLASQASAGDSSWKGIYTGQGGAGTNWTATEASFSLSLARALQSAARAMAKDVKIWLTERQAATVRPGTPVLPSPGS